VPRVRSPLGRSPPPGRVTTSGHNVEVQGRRREPRPVNGLALGVVLVVAVTLVLLPFQTDIGRASPALALVVPVVVAGIVGGRAAAIATAAAAALAFSLGFIPPVGSLRVAVSEDAVALGVFTLVAVSVGTLVALEADRRRAAEQRADEIEAMHARYEELAAERQLLQEEADRVHLLERVDEQRSALLRSVSHDLRTPLALIRAVATDLRAGVSHTPDVHEELLDMVCDEAERLDRLVANLLSMSRVEAGALRPDRQAVALEEMIRDVVRRLSRMLGDVKVELCLAPNLPLVDVDYVQMDQVLTNLLENAARYAPSGSTVHFSAAPVADMVEVTVSDHGPGIAPEALAVLFEPFRTAAGSASTGVGLAICKAIVEAHGGVITGGQAPEGGAQLRFTMPVRHG
jgi:K+-sensing histidine kinase KdpD